MKSKKTHKLPAINIQWPYSELILSGKKIVETRSYDIPKHYLGVDLALIETPGKLGKQNGIKRARIVGTITISETFQYKSKQHWEEDQSRHLVDNSDPDYKWHSNKPKWGWVIQKTLPLSKPLPAPKNKGIQFTKQVTIPRS